MKKIISIIAIIAILGAILFMLTGCGENNEDNGNDGSTMSDLGNGKINLNDDSIYYAIVDGKKYTMDDSIEDVLERGGYTRNDLYKHDQLIDPGKRFDDDYIHKGEYPNSITQFSVNVGNRTNKPIERKDCVVTRIKLHSHWFDKVPAADVPEISIVGGITLGSTKEEVKAVFGPGEYDLGSEYGDNLRGFKFEYKDGLVTGIIITRTN